MLETIKIQLNLIKSVIDELVLMIKWKINVKINEPTKNIIKKILISLFGAKIPIKIPEINIRGSVIIAKVAPAKEQITPVLVAKPNTITKIFAERIDLVFNGLLFKAVDVSFSEVFNEMINHYILGIVNEDGRKYYLTLKNKLITWSIFLV